MKCGIWILRIIKSDIFYIFESQKLIFTEGYENWLQLEKNVIQINDQENIFQLNERCSEVVFLPKTRILSPLSRKNSLKFIMSGTHRVRYLTKWLQKKLYIFSGWLVLFRNNLPRNNVSKRCLLDGSRRPNLSRNHSSWCCWQQNKAFSKLGFQSIAYFLKYKDN